MPSLSEPLGSHRTLSVMLTYQCTAACKHCGSYSNPKQGGQLDPEHMVLAINQAIDAGYEVVVFTGGEPTLVKETLLQGIRLASSRGARTRLVTNGWWAKDEDAADRQVADLIDAGLVEINFSTGDEHVRFVPLDNILWACRAAAKIPMKPIVVIIETADGRTVTRQTLFQHLQFQRIRKEFPGARVLIIESPWMPLSPTKTSRYAAGTATTSQNLPMRTGCVNCLGTTTLLPDGAMSACCGTGMRSIAELQLGNIRQITIGEAYRQASDDFLKRWIRVEGPEKILAWASTKDPGIQWEGMYANRCQSCIRMYGDPRVRKVILEHHQEKIAEVLTTEWLLYHFEPQIIRHG